jgi:hypothetical protein
MVENLGARFSSIISCMIALLNTITDMINAGLSLVESLFGEEGSGSSS